jgi:hypothetical protein
MPSPAHASSATACSVSSASHSRQSCPCATSSSGISARSRKVLHSSATSSGIAPRGSSTQTPHWRPASSTAAAQSGMRAGGHWPTGERAKRNASDRLRITWVRANRSGGHSRSSSVIGLQDAASQLDANVGSSLPWQIEALSAPVDLPANDGPTRPSPPLDPSDVHMRPKPNLSWCIASPALSRHLRS